MRATAFLLGSTLLLAACSQPSTTRTRKRTSRGPTFEADLSAYGHHNSSVTAFQANPQEQRAQLEDAIVRDCMKAKGYKIEMEAR